MDCKYCIDNLNFKVKVADIETKCKYHKKEGAVYSVSALAPEGLCRQLFYAVYPACLAVLYNGLPARGRLRKKGMREAVAGCPAPAGVRVKIRSEEILPPPLRMLKELGEELCKRFYRAFDAPWRRVVMEIIQAGPDCPKGYSAGDVFKFNINKKDELCPAGFATLYPYLRLLPHSLYVHCPDYVGVTYEIALEQAPSGGENASRQDFNDICRSYNALNLKIRYSFKNKEKEFILKDILPPGFCVLAFHNVYPYMETLVNGGWFNWVNYGEDVIVNCPAAQGIAMYVKPSLVNSPEGFQVEVMKNSCGCYKGYNLKDKFRFNFNEEDAVRYKLLDGIIPFIAGFSSGENTLMDFSCDYKGENIQYQAEVKNAAPAENKL